MKANFPFGKPGPDFDNFASMTLKVCQNFNNVDMGRAKCFFSVILASETSPIFL